MASFHQRRSLQFGQGAPHSSLTHFSLLRATGRLHTYLTSIDTADPVRQVLNRGLVPILLFYPALALLMTRGYDDLLIRAALVAFALLAIPALLLNRRGSDAGALLLTGGIVAIVAIVLEPSWYLAPLDQPLYVPSEPLVAIVIAALFISPRAGFWACGAQIGALIASALVRGTDPGAITNFAFFASLALWALTALLAIGASQFTQALRRSFQAQAELEQRVGERTAALTETNAQLETAKTQIERAAERRVTEISEVVHDARNHLSQINAAAELLAMDLEDAGVANESSRRLNHVIMLSLQSQQDLLDALLEAALLDAGALVLQAEPIDLAALVNRAIQQAEPRYSQQRCTLTFEQSADLPPVLCDERRMTRVVQNLLANALKFTTSFRRHSGTVRVTLTHEQGEAVLRIVDDGIGISADQLARLGQRFVRATGGNSTPEGSGIGLSASIGIVALHGGTLRLLSEGVGLGTTAEVWLPIASAV